MKRLEISPLNRKNWEVGIALGITLIIAAISLFLVIVGDAYSEVSANCFTAAECLSLSRIVFVPTPLAFIPLIMGLVVALGLVTRRMILAWSGTISLLFFSLLLGFSIGLYYLPLAITLFGLTAIIQNDRHVSRIGSASPTQR
ncbi:MAG TPA: hypothetical protein VGR56_10110 [Nitrososphaerales archaeon]|nr:hypothetical protein [Nitrososphaerales archaeon]